jgi:arylsulfatase A-like enzyme
MSPLAEGQTFLGRVHGRRAKHARPLTIAVDMAFRPGQILVFSVWLGLVTGVIEVLALWARRHLVDPSAVSALQLNQHASWMIPISHGLIFGSGGVLLACVAVFFHSRRAVGLGVYGLCLLSAISSLSTYRGLTTIALWSLAVGITLWVAPCLLDHARRPTRLIRSTFPALIGLVSVLFSIHIGREKIDAHWLPPAPPTAPNVLFIVLDTVRAESLSLHGYHRDTSPHLARFAERGARFDHARTAAAWTLPAHASMFTGRWPYELSARPDRPLDAAFPTLAEYLRDHGYATAGFAANTYFCSQWYGLGRGFMHYEDVALTPVEVLRSSIMGRYLVRKASLENSSRPTAYFERKDADTINGEVLAWLADRPRDRPFFAFLNYYDAHDPYLAPRQAPVHFGVTPESGADFAHLRDWLNVVTTAPPARTLQLARDGYDDCIAYLDDQLGQLFSELESKGLLENTLVVITADHGELIGERGEFGHGQSLHHEVVNVPLVLVTPRRALSGKIVAQPVTLRDLPATVVDLIGLNRDSPFPGRSLARYVASPSDPGCHEDDWILTETADEQSTIPVGTTEGRSLLAKNKLYIRTKNGREELYDLATDPAESHDLSKSAEFQPLLQQFRMKMTSIDHESEDLERARRSGRHMPRSLSTDVTVEAVSAGRDLCTSAGAAYTD